MNSDVSVVSLGQQEKPFHVPTADAHGRVFATLAGGKDRELLLELLDGISLVHAALKEIIQRLERMEEGV